MIDLLRSTYQNKKVFLTGHTGFKGSWFLAILNYLGAEVKGYALAPEDEPALFNLLNGNSLCESVIADINNLPMVTEEVKQFQPDFIFHFAAQSIVRKSYKEPINTFTTNALGTANVLEAIRSLDNECAVVIITTDKVYENLEQDYAYKETDKLGGFDPYSSSKACAEIITASYKRSFFNPDDFEKHKKSISTARSGNVIGGGDRCKDRIIPDMIKALEAGQPLQVRNPASVRPWQHVLEPLGGYLLLGAKQKEDPIKFADSFNFGPAIDDDLSVEGLIEIALKFWGSGSYEKPDTSGNPHEAGLLQLDISKARLDLDWEPRFTSELAITKTMEWYKNAVSSEREYTLNQIKSYFE